MNRATVIADIINKHVDFHGPGPILNAAAVSEMIVDRLDHEDAPLSKREEQLLQALWMIVRSAGGKVRVSVIDQRAYQHGVSMLDSRMDPITKAMVYEVIK